MAIHWERDVSWDDDDDDVDREDAEAESEFRAALAAGQVDRAQALIDSRAADPATPGWLVTSMLQDVGMWLARAGRHDEAIASFERALSLGWNVVPDGRCEIARVMLLAGRHAEADALWSELREADPDGVWTLNAGGMAYGEVGRDAEAIEWLGAGIKAAIASGAPEHVLDQMSDVRRACLTHLEHGLDDLERSVEVLRAQAAVRRQQEMTEFRAAAARIGVPVRGQSATVVWLTEEDDRVARERWPGWVDGLAVDETFEQRRVRMERRLREQRAQGDGPLVVVTIDLEDYATWCSEHGHEPIDRRSRASFAEVQRALGDGSVWPPGRNDPCWCGSERKYKRCCGG